MRERHADGASHERRGARRRRNYRKRAGEEAAGIAAALCQPAAGVLQRTADLEHAEKIEADGEEKQRQRTGHPRRLQLKAPSDRLTCAAQSDQQTGQRKERRHDAGEVEQPVRARFARMRPAGERERFHRKHRQNARHDVEDQAAKEGEPERKKNSGSVHRRSTGRNAAAFELRERVIIAHRSGRAVRVGQRLTGLRFNLDAAQNPIGAILHFVRDHALQRRLPNARIDAPANVEAYAAGAHARALRR